MTHEHETASWSPDAEHGAELRGAPARLPRPGELLAGRFLIQRLLGSGGSGAVFAAVDERLGQRVAVKVIHPHLADDSVMRRLRREVQASRSGHPNLLSVYDMHIAGGLTFLSMELVEGSSLRARLEAFKALGVDETVEVGRQIAGALAHFHAAGLVHRDVKPGNVLVVVQQADRPGSQTSLQGTGDRGQETDPPNQDAEAPQRTWSAREERPLGGTSLVAKLCDLGLVRPLGHGDTLTRSSVTVGTPAYMAPEQGRGDELTGKADVYALGITLYECLTGTVPLLEDSAVATLVLRQQSRAPSVRRELPWCPRWLDGLVTRMLDPDPRRRPDAAEVERTLASGRLRFRFPVKQLITLTAALALAAVGAVGWQWLRTSRTARIETAGNVIRGVDDRGRETWSYTLENPIRQVERADLNGDNVAESIVAAWPDPMARGAGAKKSDVLIVSPNGVVMTHCHPEDLVLEWPYDYPRLLQPIPQLVDIDQNGRPEVVVRGLQRTYFPAALLAYWPQNNHWDLLLIHSGHIYDVAAVTDCRPPCLRFPAVNNRLGGLAVIGEVAVLPPNERKRISTVHGLLSPEEGGGVSTSCSWTSYTILDEGVNPENVLRVLPDGSSRLETSQPFILDRWGNPALGENRGRDMRRLRIEIMKYLSSLSISQQPLRATDIVSAIDGLHLAAGPLLAERPYRAVFGFWGARALATAGDSAGATTMLSALYKEIPYEEVAYRLAHLHALAGDLTQARELLEDIAASARTPRGRFDAPELLLRIAIEERNAGMLSSVLLRFHNASLLSGTEQAELLSTLWARAHVWWDEATEGDGYASSSAYAPDGDATGCLARWRTGHLTTADVDRMQDAAENNPDAAWESRIAQAVALLGLDRPQDTLRRLAPVIAGLELSSRTDFTSRQLLDLATAIHLQALAASGQTVEAVAKAEKFCASLRPGLLPAILCDEVKKAGGPTGNR